MTLSGPGIWSKEGWGYQDFAVGESYRHELSEHGADTNDNGNELCRKVIESNYDSLW